MKKQLLQFIYGICVFLIGVTMSEFFRWRTVGDLIAYGGLIYVVIILSQTSWAKRTFNAINHLLAKPIHGAHGNESTNPDKPPSKLLAIFVLFVFPVLLHMTLLGVLAHYDPCTGNSGCMAGSLTTYFSILLTIPIMLLLLVITLVQVFSAKYNNYRKYLKVNTILSASPFVVGFAGLAVISIVQ